MWKRAALKLFAALVIADLLCLAFGALSIWRGNPFLLYYPYPFSRMTAEQLAIEAGGSATGWPIKRSIRPQTRPQPSTCGAAIGGSFTFADDVTNDEAWPAVLSGILGCNVDNLGVDAFDLDQAIIDYREAKRGDEFVVVGISSVMLIADASASWSFYSPGPDHLPKIRLTKPFFRINDAGDTVFVPRPPPQPWAIEAHHEDDLFRSMWTPLLPPFSYRIATAIYKRLFEDRAADIDANGSSKTDIRLRSLAWKIMRWAKKDFGQRPIAIVMIPTPEYALSEAPDYAQYLGEIRAALPGTCIIDPHPRLHNAIAGRSLNEVRSASGHFTAIGNAALAEAVAAGLHDCGIGP